MKVTINIETRTFVRAALVLLIFAAGVYLFFKLSGALTTIAIAAFLAIALNPPVSAISKYLPSNSRVFATTIAYLLVVSILGLVTVLVVPPIVDQSRNLVREIPQLVDEISTQQQPVSNFIEQYGLENDLENSIESIRGQSQNIVANFGEVLVGSAGAFVSGIVTLLIVLILAFLMLIEGPSIMKKVWKLYENPRKMEHHKSLTRKMYEVVSGYVTGQVIIAAIAAVLSFVVVLILGLFFDVPANIGLPIAGVIFITTMIPMIGATLGAIVASVLVLLNDPFAAVIFAIYFVIYQQIENNFIAVLIQSKTVDVSALTVLIAIFIGFNFFGLLGGLIAIPIAGCIRVLIKDYLERSDRADNKGSKKPRSNKTVASS